MGETSFIERASNSPGGERTEIEEDCASPDDVEPRDECCDEGKESLGQPSTKSKDWTISFLAPSYYYTVLVVIVTCYTFVPHTLRTGC